MFPQAFEIELDQPSQRFMAGQLITGRVILVLQKEKAVKGICIRLLGRGYVYWEVGISGLKYSHNIHTETEVYADIKKRLLYRDDGKEQKLEAGRHEYNFSIQLPPNLPSSIETPCGNIKYTLEAAIQRSWKDDTTFIKHIFVKGLIDLNAEPKAAELVKIFKEKYIGFILCYTGTLGVSLSLSKAGFVPGEILQFSLEIKNTTSIKVGAVIISLRSHLTCKVGEEMKSHSEKVVQCVGPSAEAKGYLLWQNYFEIPDLPPNPLEACTIMELKYYLELKLVLERWSDLKICTPLLIGSIPYSSSDGTNSVGTETKLPPINHEPVQANLDHRPKLQFNHTAAAMNCCSTDIEVNSGAQGNHLPLPILDWGSSACLAEIEKITSRPVQTVPSFLLSATENLYAMSMGSCDKMSTNYEILDDRHILFEGEEAFVEMCSTKLQNMFLREENGHNKDLFG